MFKPWEGAAYDQQTPRTLILGESHYGDAHIKYNYPVGDKTILTIQEQMINAWPSRFHTKVAATLIGHLPSLTEKERFWNSVAYHNLITEPLSGARIAPRKDQWIASVATLPAVFAALQPEYCLCLGYRMWRVLTHQLPHAIISVPADIGPCGAFWSKLLRCLFHGIMHPSGKGYSRGDWYQRIINLKRAKWS